MSLWSMFGEGSTMKNVTMVLCYEKVNHAVFHKNDSLVFLSEPLHHGDICPMTSWQILTTAHAMYSPDHYFLISFQYNSHIT